MIDVDEADVAFLEESLNKSKTLISDLNLGLKKITHTSQRSETLIKPMIDTSHKLEIYQTNIKQCLKLVDKVKDLANIVAQYEAIINNLSILDTNLPKYIQCLVDSKKLLNDMRKLKIDEFRGIFDNILNIIKRGEANLLGFSKQSIIKYSEPFDPRPIMTQNLEFPVLDDQSINNLMLIIQYFADFRTLDRSSEDFLEIEKIYIEQRQNYIKQSLQFLYQGCIPISKGAGVPYEKNSNQINHYTAALNQFMITENLLIINVFSNIKYTSENKLKNAVLSAAKKLRIFEKLFRNVLSDYVDIINKIIEHVNKNYASDGILSFELVECYLKLSPTFDQVNATKGNNSSVGQLEAIFTSVKAMACTLFTDYMRFIDTRVSGIVTIPADNGVSEVTIELMSRLRKFSEYRIAVADVISTMKPGTWIPSPKPQWLSVFSSVSTTNPIDDKNPQLLLSSYFSDCIDAIMVSLEIKAKVLIPRKTSTVGYFLVTNLTLIDQIAKKSEVYTILGATGLERLDKLRKRFLNMFLSDWKALASTLMDVTVTAANKKSKVSSKDKDQIKDKFKTFNSEFDELVKSFKSFNIKDQQLRQFLVKDISFIIPLYNRFHEKYSSGEFSKHSSKYIKYDKSTLAGIIQGL